MKVGKFVQHNIPAILKYCEAQNPTEFARLQDPRYSKETFDINYPFCRPITKIELGESNRFWTKQYLVHGVPVRITSQWFSKSLPLLQTYLKQRGIFLDGTAVDVNPGSPADAINITNASRPNPKHRNAIGNAQNLFIRYLLSSIADEDFSADDWQAVLEDFGNGCAYCGAEGELNMDHVVPLNKRSLGQHRLGNLVPACPSCACPSCNAKKAAKDFREFLVGDAPRIATIENHMAKYGYEPKSDYKILRQIVDLAHQDVRSLADRYVKIIKTLHQDS